MDGRVRISRSSGPRRHPDHAIPGLPDQRRLRAEGRSSPSGSGTFRARRGDGRDRVPGARLPRSVGNKQKTEKRHHGRRLIHLRSDKHRKSWQKMEYKNAQDTHFRCHIRNRPDRAYPVCTIVSLQQMSMLRCGRLARCTPMAVLTACRRWEQGFVDEWLAPSTPPSVGISSHIETILPLSR
jgi:hypothetical protein